MRSLVKQLARQDVAIFQQTAAEEITSVRNFNFAAKFDQNGEFPAPNCAFLEKNATKKTIFNRLKFTVQRH